MSYLAPVSGLLQEEVFGMGKGDQRTRRGKLYRGSFGKTRPSKKKAKKRGGRGG
jgi:30S ribosomal protein S31